MAIDHGRVKDLLGAGLDQNVVAKAVGCTPAYIGQLLQDEEFRREVTTLRVEKLQAASLRDARIDDLEDRALAKVAETLDYIFKPREVLAAASMLNRMQRRGVAPDGSLGAQKEVVRLTIPQVLIQNFTLNGLSEVVDVAGQTMVGMSAHSLMQKLQREAMQSQEVGSQQRYKKVASHISGAAAGVTVLENSEYQAAAQQDQFIQREEGAGSDIKLEDL